MPAQRGKERSVLVKVRIADIEVDGKIYGSVAKKDDREEQKILHCNKACIDQIIVSIENIYRGAD